MSEPSQIGLSEVGHDALTSLETQRHFASMMDAYRFAIAFALAEGARPSALTSPRKNMYAASAIDPDGSIATAIGILWPDTNEPLYRRAELLADWGAQRLWDLANLHNLDVGEILKRFEEDSSQAT